uniref:Exopolyphosphatase n=1 Tax=Chenopodium quinoa TaxID=63459 RepID=A0A803KNT8_CHEQI
MANPLKSQNIFASIDMGTNTFKLLIIHIEPTTAKFTTIYSHSDAVKLGRSSSSSSLISPDSQFRAIESLKKFQEILRSNNVTQIRPVGTSAIREAGNRSIFLKEVRENLGFDFEVNVLSGVEEARLIYVDIGGGSTEFVVGEHGEVVYADSLRLGHLMLTQKFGENDLVGVRDYVRELIEGSKLVGKVKNLGFEVAIGSSGTIRAIEKAIWCGYGCDDGGREIRVLGEGKRRKWWWFSREELRVLVERLCEGGFSEREKARRDGFFDKRSEFIVAGAILLEEIMELLGISEMEVSRYALGEGVVAEMVSEAFPGLELNANVRWKSVMRLALRFNGNDRMKNGVQCSSIAKDIFYGLRKYNKVFEDRITVELCLDEKDFEYLEAACMFHNIGLYFGKKSYHKQSCSIIKEQSQLDGYTSEEIELIAQLARHHRKKFPKFECTFLQNFSREKFGLFCSILRISVIIQQHKLLKLREIKFDDSGEGFVLALVNKGDLPMLPDSEKSLAKDIEAKMGKEAEYFEAVQTIALSLKLEVIDCSSYGLFRVIGVMLAYNPVELTIPQNLGTGANLGLCHLISHSSTLCVVEEQSSQISSVWTVP